MSERLVPRRGAKPWQQQAITHQRQAAEFAYEQALLRQGGRGFAEAGETRDPQNFAPVSFKTLKGPLSPQAARALAAFEAAERAQQAQMQAQPAPKGIKVKPAPVVQPFLVDPLLRRPGFVSDVFEWETIQVDEEPFEWMEDDLSARNDAEEPAPNLHPDHDEPSENLISAPEFSQDSSTQAPDASNDLLALDQADMQALENPAVDIEAMQRVVNVARHHGETEGERKAQEALAAQRAALLHEQAELDRQRQAFAQAQHAQETRLQEEQARMAQLQHTLEQQLSALEQAKVELENREQALQRQTEEAAAAMLALAQERQEMAQRREEMASDLEDLAKGRAGIVQEVADQRELFEQAAQAIKAILEQPQSLYEPLKRLALSLAERIALTEIESNAHLYATLVERCLETLDLPAKGMVVIDLNPADKTRLEAAVPSALQGMRLNAVEDLKPGSVRVYANDAIIDDFIEQRLQAVARSVLSQPQAWQSHSIVLNSSNDSETPDVHP